MPRITLNFPNSALEITTDDALKLIANATSIDHSPKYPMHYVVTGPNYTVWLEAWEGTNLRRVLELAHKALS